MKILAAVVLIALAAFGVVAGASAQSGNSPAGGAVSTPSADVKDPDSGKSDDGASALPRTVASERTTIFGLTPTAAVVIAAALLVVVILAIVAMTRTDDTYMER